MIQKSVEVEVEVEVQAKHDLILLDCALVACWFETDGLLIVQLELKSYKIYLK